MKNLLLVLVCLCSFQTYYSQNNWELLNPTPSYNTGEDMDFTSAQTGFILTKNEILETQDAGITWIKNRSITSGNDMAYLNDLGYIVGDNGYVLKSLDGGTTWNTISIGSGQDLNTVNIIDESNIIISSSSSLIKTTDGGTTWQISNIPDVSVNKTFFVNSTIGHAACKNGTILKTIDGGETWYSTQTSNVIPTDYYTIYFINENIGFASREFTDVYKTTDGGETWNQISTINDAIYRFQFLNENEGYITGEYGVIYKTTDGGTTWSFIGFQNGYLGNTSMYGIHFQDNNIGYATGARGRIIKTTDGGASWSEYSPTYNNIRQIQFLNDYLGYAATGDTFYKTLDAGITWQKVGSLNLSYTQASEFTFVNQNVGYATTGDTYGGQVYKTTDGGSTWNVLYNGFEVIDEGISSIAFLDENTGLVSGGFNQKLIRKTVDGGVNWETIGYMNFAHMQFITNEIGYANAGNYADAMLYKTIDGGTTWNLVFENDDAMGSFYFINENVGYLVGDYSLIYKTMDGGATWEQLTIPYGFYTLVKFQNEDIGYVADEYGMIYFTEDGGENWELNTIQYGVNDIEITDNVVYTGGVSGKIFRKIFGTLSTKNVSNNLNFVVFPNPTDKSVMVKSKTRITKIEIYNNLGQLVLTEKIGKNIDISALTPGLYFLKATDNFNTIGIKKIIKIK